MSSTRDTKARQRPGEPARVPAVPADIRMVAGLGVMLVLVILGIVIAVWLILDLRRTTTDFTEREIEYAAAIGDIALVSKTLANDERGFLISGSDEFLRQFEGRTAQLNEAFSRAYANADSEQWLAVDRAKQSFDAWHDETTRNMARFAAGNRDAAIEASLEQTRVLRKEYEARLSGTQSLAKFEIEAASDEVAATITRSLVILIGYLAVAVAIGSFIAVWLLQSVLKPVQGLLAAKASEEGAGPGQVAPAREKARSD
jgi:CHASE3 domain sensor protein